ncbi:hypothetical protein [Micromonospora sp. WMMD1155]|uniref:hypothetical protein n=1 Tax=Micromonospora sp. WMMD1155 TaxID=3016094 RepID=UPI00249B5F82|nr:hypothetical protein [Micromonospora sp. WMMD1155]WFE49969.1 hypothetical protein O7617_06380 [Micromonospora sp. WMMD1155]
MNRSLVRAVGVLAALAALAGATACSPVDKPVLALRVVNEQPTLLVAECGVFTADRISVFTIGVTPTKKWAIIREGGAEAEAVTLLEPPPAWTVEQQTLATFEPAVEYAVTAYGDQTDADSVHFTLAQLTELGPDQVLVSDGGTKRKAVTETAFRDKAKKAC